MSQFDKDLHLFKSIAMSPATIPTSDEVRLMTDAELSTIIQEATASMSLDDNDDTMPPPLVVALRGMVLEEIVRRGGRSPQ